ncbi:hypothetical protein [Trichoplusia ni ascovirus 6b]|nr:hypothetical protein [Trichoplusia ni ascovirus 6b]
MLNCCVIQCNYLECINIPYIIRLFHYYSVTNMKRTLFVVAFTIVIIISCSVNGDSCEQSECQNYCIQKGRRESTRLNPILSGRCDYVMNKCDCYDNVGHCISE